MKSERIKVKGKNVQRRHSKTKPQDKNKKSEESPKLKKEKMKKDATRTKTKEKSAISNVEHQLHDMEPLEELLPKPPHTLLPCEESHSFEKHVMQYILQEEVNRTDRLALHIEDLQQRVMVMQQQEEMDLQQSQKRLNRLQGIVHFQAAEIERLRQGELDGKARTGVVEKDSFDCVKKLMEENRHLNHEKKLLVKEHRKEKKEWKKKLATIEETISFLLQELKTLKTADKLADSQPNHKDSFSSFARATQGEESGSLYMPRPTPESPKCFMTTLKPFLSPPKLKCTNKEKISTVGMDKDAMKPPLNVI
jgi:hypothetical protein